MDFNRTLFYCNLLYFRCNGDYNCPDRSDEAACDIIWVDDSYLTYYPAPPIKGEGNKSEIFLSVALKSVLDIKEVESTINVQFVLSLKWKDPRIIYRNLKEENFLNQINLGEFENIWRPVVVFYNTEHRDKTKASWKHVKMTD